jgi:hypothetical protein
LRGSERFGRDSRPASKRARKIGWIAIADLRCYLFDGVIRTAQVGRRASAPRLFQQCLKRGRAALTLASCASSWRLVSSNKFECMQNKMRTLWGLDQGSLAYCAESCPNQSDYWQDHAVFLAKVFADRPSGFIDAIEDSLMRGICGTGLRDCTGDFLFDATDAAVYWKELLSYRDKLKPFSN